MQNQWYNSDMKEWQTPIDRVINDAEIEFNLRRAEDERKITEEKRERRKQAVRHPFQTIKDNERVKHAAAKLCDEIVNTSEAIFFKGTLTAGFAVMLGIKRIRSFQSHAGKAPEPAKRRRLNF